MGSFGRGCHDAHTLRKNWANGQTTVKSFADGAEAETASEKAIIEKTKKGYVEKSAHTDATADTNGAATTEDSQVAAAKAEFQHWVSTYQPIAYINFVLDVIPDNLTEEHIWSELYGDESSFLCQGLYDQSSVSGHYITAIPTAVDDKLDFVVTEITRICETCDGEGDLEDELCDDCEGAGNIYIEVDENAYGGRELQIISSVKDLEKFLKKSAPIAKSSKADEGASVAKFCSNCGAPRSAPAAKFCGECGNPL